MLCRWRPYPTIQFRYSDLCTIMQMSSSIRQASLNAIDGNKEAGTTAGSFIQFIHSRLHARSLAYRRLFGFCVRPKQDYIITSVDGRHVHSANRCFFFTGTSERAQRAHQTIDTRRIDRRAFEMIRLSDVGAVHRSPHAAQSNHVIGNSIHRECRRDITAPIYTSRTANDFYY